MQKLSIRWFVSGVITLVLLGQTGCVPLAVGAAAGYVAHEEGYRVQSPLKKVDD